MCISSRPRSNAPDAPPSLSPHDMHPLPSHQLHLRCPRLSGGACASAPSAQARHAHPPLRSFSNTRSPASSPTHRRCLRLISNFTGLYPPQLVFPTTHALPPTRPPPFHFSVPLSSLRKSDAAVRARPPPPHLQLHPSCTHPTLPTPRSFTRAHPHANVSQFIFLRFEDLMRLRAPGLLRCISNFTRVARTPRTSPYTYSHTRIHTPTFLSSSFFGLRT